MKHEHIIHGNKIEQDKEKVEFGKEKLIDPIQFENEIKYETVRGFIAPNLSMILKQQDTQKGCHVF